MLFDLTFLLFDGSLEQAVVRFMVGLLSFLVVMLLSLGVLSLWRPEVFSRVLVRGISWCPVFVFVFGGIGLGRHVMSVLWTLMCARALFELHDTYEMPRFIKVLHYGGGVVGGLSFVCLPWHLALFVSVASVMVGGVVAVLGLARHQWGRALSWQAMTLALSMGVWLCWLPSTASTWAAHLLFCLAIPQLSDVLQFIGGKAFGRHTLAPQLSPSKTWEGLIIGLAGSSLVGVWVGPGLLSLPMWSCLLVSLVLGVVGALGDLLLSAVKRHACIKDFRLLLPEFGGVLDRVDSWVLNAPVFVMLSLWLNSMSVSG